MIAKKIIPGDLSKWKFVFAKIILFYDAGVLGTANIRPTILPLPLMKINKAENWYRTRN
jgi:hypothetical protein